MKTEQITIIGLDRIGASVGLALQEKLPDVTIVGHDAERSLTQQALDLKAIDKAEWNLVNSATNADILVINVPMRELELTLKAVGNEIQDHTLVIDLSQLKERGQKWAKQYIKQGHYIGARLVLAVSVVTDEQIDANTARADLFQQTVFCLMPSATADPQAVETAVNFGHLLGALPYFLDAGEYDGLQHGIETLPSLMAVALFNAIRQSTGWRDMLRFADENFALSTLPLDKAQDAAFLAMDNPLMTLRWVDALEAELRRLRQWINEGDAETLGAIWEEMAIQRAEWLHERTQNNWVEVDNEEVQMPSLAEQMFGRRLAGKGNKKQ